MSDICYLVSSPSRGQNDAEWPRAPGQPKQAFTMNDSLSISCLAFLMAPGTRRHLSGSVSPRACRGQVLGVMLRACLQSQSFTPRPCRLDQSNLTAE